MKCTFLRSVLFTALAFAFLAPGALRAQNPASPPTTFKFDFGGGKVAAGYTQVLPDQVYRADKGYGFFPGATLRAENQGGKDALRSDFITSDQPFFFTVDVPEGNYNVTVTLGDRKGTSKTTVKAECRRLMLEQVTTKKGQFETRTFTVHVRNPLIGTSGDKVRLKSRELSYLHW